MVSPEKNIFHCFGCGAGGNALRFLTQLENLSFPEAAAKLAGRAGITITHDPQADLARAEKEQLYRINKYAVWFFTENLKGPIGKKAKSYLEKRGLSQETIDIFQLGYAPAQWESLVSFLTSKKVPLALAEKLGLIKSREGGGYYDFFRDRVMFPIIDFDNRIVGFSGRRLNDAPDSKEAKYVNSPESPIYHKSATVYGLYQAKKALRDKASVLLVEGNVDLISLHQAGFQNVAAPLGTALTADQIRILKRFAEKFIVLFDGDAAGKNATLKAINLFFEAGVHPHIVDLPNGTDPDSFLKRKDGQKELEAQIANAPFAMEWLLFKTLGAAGANPAERLEAASRLLPYIEALPSPLEKQTYNNKLAHFLGIPESQWKSETARNSSKSFGRKTTIPPTNFSLERILLQLYVKYPNIAEQLVGNAFDWFEDERLKKLGKTLQVRIREESSFSLDKWLAEMSPEDGELISALLLESDKWESPEELTQLITDSISKLRMRAVKNELKTITGEINLAELKKDPQELNLLVGKKSEALKKLKSLSNP